RLLQRQLAEEAGVDAEPLSARLARQVGEVNAGLEPLRELIVTGDQHTDQRTVDAVRDLAESVARLTTMVESIRGPEWPAAPVAPVFRPRRSARTGPGRRDRHGRTAETGRFGLSVNQMPSG